MPAMAGRAGSLALRGGAAKKKSHFLSKKEKELLETLSKGEVLSAEEPGELAGKEDTHVPVATATEKGVRIEVKHVMNDEDEKTGQEIHYIEFVWMMDSETGAALGYKRLTPGKNQEASAELVGFDYSGRTVTPYAMCNLHGVWRGANVTIAGEKAERPKKGKRSAMIKFKLVKRKDYTFLTGERDPAAFPKVLVDLFANKGDVMVDLPKRDTYGCQNMEEWLLKATPEDKEWLAEQEKTAAEKVAGFSEKSKARAEKREKAAAEKKAAEEESEAENDARHQQLEAAEALKGWEIDCRRDSEQVLTNSKHHLRFQSGATPNVAPLGDGQGFPGDPARMPTKHPIAKTIARKLARKTGTLPAVPPA